MIFAGIPYVEGFQKKLAEVKNYEGFYEYTFWLIFNMLNVYVRTQVKCTGGRIDFVVEMLDTVYVFELKVHGSAQEARFCARITSVGESITAKVAQILKVWRDSHSILTMFWEPPDVRTTKGVDNLSPPMKAMSRRHFEFVSKTTIFVTRHEIHGTGKTAEKGRLLFSEER